MKSLSKSNELQGLGFKLAGELIDVRHSTFGVGDVQKNLMMPKPTNDQSIPKEGELGLPGYNMAT